MVAIVDGCDGKMRVERADEGADGFVRRGQGVAAGAEEEETDRHMRSHMVAVGNLAGRMRWCACELFKRHHYVHFEVTRRVSRAYLGRNSPVQTPEYPQGVQVSSARHHNGQRQRGHVDAHADNLAILLLLRWRVMSVVAKGSPQARPKPYRSHEGLCPLDEVQQPVRQHSASLLVRTAGETQPERHARAGHHARLGLSHGIRLTASRPAMALPSTSTGAITMRHVDRNS